MDVVFFFGGWEAVGRIIVVGTLAYIALVLLLRLTGARTLARMNAFDLIITVALGASFGRLLTARSVALIEAVTVFALLVGLQYVVAMFKRRSPTFARLISSPPTLLYYRGQFAQDAIRWNQLTEQDLRTAVRKEGVGSLEQVEAIVMETDGKFSIIPSDKAGELSALGDEVVEEAFGERRFGGEAQVPGV